MKLFKFGIILILSIKIDLIYSDEIDDDIEIPYDEDIIETKKRLNKNSKVIELESNNIALFNSSKYSVVFFYEENSDETESIMTEYNKASLLSFQQNLPFKFFKVNLEKYENMDIDKSDPLTIKIYINERWFLYEGIYYSKNIIRNLHILLEGPITLLNNLNEIDNFKKEYELKFIFLTTIKEDSSDYQIIKNFTELNGIFINTIKCYSNECINEFGENSIFLLKNYDEKKVKLDEKISKDSLEKLLKEESLEILAELDKNTFLMISTFNITSVIYFRNSNNKEQIEKDNILKELGKKYKKTFQFFKTDIKGDLFKKEISDLFLINQNDLPTVEIFDPKNYHNYQIKTKEISLKTIEEFIIGVKEGKIERELNSDEIPLKDIYSFNTIVGKTFNKIVLESNKPYLVLFMKNNKNLCPECSEAGIAFKEVSDKYMEGLNDKRFGMGAIDLIYNEVKRNISNVPLISFYNIPGKNEIIDYNGKYTKKDLEKFIADSLNWSEIPMDIELDFNKEDL